jgi:hypothetical protein
MASPCSTRTTSRSRPDPRRPSLRPSGRNGSHRAPAQPPGARAQVCARQFFQGLNCSFAQLFQRGTPNPPGAQAAHAASQNPGVPAPARRQCQAPVGVGFVLGVDEGLKRRKRRESFAKRNQRFRDDGRKPLKSLEARNQAFREIVCFQSLNRLFVSRSSPACALSTRKERNGSGMSSPF